jgi:hypothetical protein
MAVGSVERLALVISSNMFNLDSGLGHVLTMLVAPGPGPYSFELTVESEQLHVWPAHLDSTPKHLFIERLGVADPVAISAAHTRLFMILHESNVPPPR